MIKSRRLRWTGHVARMEEGRSAFKILTGKPTGKRPLGRPRHRWEDNIRMTEVTSTPTRPVENVVLATKGLQDKNNNC